MKQLFSKLEEKQKKIQSIIKPPALKNIKEFFMIKKAVRIEEKIEKIPLPPTPIQTFALALLKKKKEEKLLPPPPPLL